MIGLLLFLLAAVPPIGEYGTPPNLVYVLEKDGAILQYSEKSGYQKFDPKTIAGLPRRQPPVIKPVRPLKELLVEALKATPPPEEGEFRTFDLVELTSQIPGIKLDIRYATSNNFLGIPLYSQARAFLERPAADSLREILADLRPQGYGLLIHDGYRPWYVTKMFWDAVPDEDHVFVADPSKGSRHNRGCAVDLSLYDLKTGKSIEMPGGYDEMSERSYPDFPGGTTRQRAHRDLLRHAMETRGFTVYEAEWWHFDYKDWARYPILNIRFETIQ